MERRGSGLTRIVEETKKLVGFSKEYILLTVILFSVSVPVLSEHTTLAHPKVSTAVNFLTKALRLSMRLTPSAKAIVTIAGNPSGTAATERDIPIISISNTGSPLNIPVIETTEHITKHPIAIYLPNWSSLF